MIRIPELSSSVINLLGIDPGSTYLGFCVMSVDLESRAITRTMASSINANKLSGNFYLSELYGDRHSRIAALMQAIEQLLNDYQPFAIISEAPFFNPRRPGAFEALVQVLCALRATIFNHDCLKPLHQVDPSSVKNAVGAKGGAEKLTVRDAVLALPDLHFEAECALEDIDEHGIDSIAVCYWFYTKYIKG